MKKGDEPQEAEKALAENLDQRLRLTQPSAPANNFQPYAAAAQPNHQLQAPAQPSPVGVESHPATKTTTKKNKEEEEEDSEDDDSDLDEFDDDDIIYSKINDSNYVFEGKTSLKDFYKIIKLEDESIFESKKGESETLAGFVLEISKSFPKIKTQYKFKTEANTLICKNFLR